MLSVSPDLWLSLSLFTQALSILPLVLIAILGINLGALVLLRLRRSAIDEGASKPLLIAPAEAWPTVLVQIPIFNEGLLVRPCLEAVTGLDYPASKLSIQLLDDSDDGSAANNRLLAEQVAAQSGLPIDVIQRSDRSGFKAGALAVGLAGNAAEFVAVFDVDFLPPQDFLQTTLPPLLDDPSVGFVQARWAHRNPSVSWLTRAQATLLDGHFRVEQAGRYRHRLPIAFNGTCGLWRTAVIADAGGWQGDTLSEDLDLSLRAQLAGYRGIFLDDVPVAGELLTSTRAWQQQQFRWTKGHVQVLRKLGPRLFQAPWPMLTRLAVLLQIAQGLFFPLAACALLLSLPGVILDNPPHGSVAAALSVIGLGGLLGASLFLAFGRRLAGDSWPRSLLETLSAMFLLGGLLLSNSRAALEGLAGRPSAFIRSDKPGARAPSLSTRVPSSATALPAAQTLAGLGILGLFVLERAWNAPFLATTALGLLAVALPQLQTLLPIRR
ncbi:MAG: glycosyltransferase [Lamprobacter sp.]|uniref:glycosyltransferase n=1 Tax=Lamprobacter sp. TaxID=3100796 RepID=UPI002B257B65|nr:glycosyltransferase family 2 protein [Lamprobacter sp.]MEA3641242.1 glycosyltransferase [Lamprobacter sp.]